MKIQLRVIVSEITGYDNKTVDAYIMSGKVLVDEKVCTKPGELFKEECSNLVRIREPKEFVSRGAYKLLAGIETFKPIIENRVCIDAGSSTGGFTQILLEHKAKLVYAVDCGSNQLDFALRNDKRVVSIEGIRVQDVPVDKFEPFPKFAVADLSFTSCVAVVGFLFEQLLIENAIVLIKPQFEYNRLKEHLNLSDNFDGIVTSVEDREKIVKHICVEIENMDINVAGIMPSPIKGTNGNEEFLAYLKENKR